MALSSPVASQNWTERVATDDVFVLDRLTQGTMIDTREVNAVVDNAIATLETHHMGDALTIARVGIKIISRAAFKNARIGRLAVHAVMVLGDRHLDNSRPAGERVAKHGKARWALRRLGKHAAR